MKERFVTDLDFVSLYPSIIMAYNLSPEKNHIGVRKADNVHKMGMSFIRLSLNSISVMFKLDAVELKTCLASLEKKKRHLGKMKTSAKERSKRILESFNLKYSSVCFDYNYLDSKQKALKVYINTFYGEAGNSKSPIFLCELACRTTIVRKYNLNLVVEFVSRKGFRIKYGDTDFLYLTCPD
ncbi:12584_t:CDS:2, partial [Funneliformis geosporum]